MESEKLSSWMTKSRMEAFSDGVIAIIITVMVLEFKVPKGTGITALIPLMPTLLSYTLSFVSIGIYWNNHHHLLQAAKNVNGRILWANLHLLFWLSLFPFVTSWLGESNFSKGPVALYGIILFFAAVAYTILTISLVKHHGKESTIGKAIGSDFKGKLSLALYLVAIGLSFVNSWIACSLYFLVAAIWLTPDKRIEGQK